MNDDWYMVDICQCGEKCGFPWIWILTRLPSGYVKIAIENGPFIVDLPIQNGDFP